MNFLLSALGKIDLFTSYLKGIEKEKGPILVSGLSDVAKVHIVSGTKEYLKRPICIITYNEIQAKKLINDLKYFEKEILYFPKREIVTKWALDNPEYAVRQKSLVQSIRKLK